jgi:hypothetical protein
MAAVQPADLRLLNRHGAVKGTGIAPGFVFVRCRDQPGARLGRLIGIEREADRQRDALQRGCEVEIDGCAVERVRLQHQQCVDPAGCHVGDELLQRLLVLHWKNRNRLDRPDCLSERSQLPVDGIGEEVHLDPLLAPGVDQSTAFVLREILRRRGQPGCVLCVRLGPFLRPGSDCGGEMAHPVQDLFRPHRQPMIGLGAVALLAAAGSANQRSAQRGQTVAWCLL